MIYSVLVHLPGISALVWNLRERGFSHPYLLPHLCIIGIRAQKTFKTDPIQSPVWLYPQREIIPLGGLSSLAGRKWCYYFVLSSRGRQAVTFQPGP